MEKQDTKENVTVDDVIEEFGAEEALKILSMLNDKDFIWAKDRILNAKKVRN